MPKTKVYFCHSDAGHGWLAVKRAELVRLGIADKITHFSYQRGKTVYLEEDCDCSLFFKAKEAADEKLEPSDLRQAVHHDRSPIRSYEAYCP
jgi:hypothetical protein